VGTDFVPLPNGRMQAPGQRILQRIALASVLAAEPEDKSDEEPDEGYHRDLSGIDRADDIAVVHVRVLFAFPVPLLLMWGIPSVQSFVPPAG
jgi:hypothetical protein